VLVTLFIARKGFQWLARSLSSQDPFRGGDNIMVMCDAYEPPRDIDGKHIDMKPIPTNTRYACAEAMKKAEAEEPWFGIEQVCSRVLSKRASW
jgi:glutamine synthetase